MKLQDHCHGCLRGLVEKAVALSYGDGDILFQAYSMMDNLWNSGRTPPEIANRLHRFIRDRTGVYDPYRSIKAKEIEEARKAIDNLHAAFPETLEGLIKYSSLGNSMDFFCHDGFTIEGFDFSGDIDKITKEIYTKGNVVLMLADNVGEFLFDIKLIGFLEDMGKTVYYAVKENPIQNDLSMPDIERFGFRKIFPNIISTGTDEVGIRKEDLRGKIKELWEGNGIVIAKGMGNYETISDFNVERSVIHIMKVKCPTVAHAVDRNVGQYIAIIGGGEYGNEKRLL
jgi:damage-control phosphatase, subfamily I